MTIVIHYTTPGCATMITDARPDLPGYIAARLRDPDEVIDVSLGGDNSRALIPVRHVRQVEVRP